MDSRFREFVRAVHNDPALGGVNFRVFRLESTENADWPMVDWIPRSGSFALALGTSQQVGVGTDAPQRVQTPYEDHINTEIRVWEENFDKCEDLRNRVICSMRRFQGARFDPGTYEWFNEQDETAEYAISGVLCVLQTVIRVPVPSERANENRMTDETHTGDFVSDLDGSTETICS